MFKVSEEHGQVVIIQCDSGHLNGDLIACARYRIYDLRAKAEGRNTTHVLFIIHLPHHVANSSFVGFQGDPWISSHIDDLRPTSDTGVSAYEAIGLSISELFLGQSKAKPQEHFVGEESKGEIWSQEHERGMQLPLQSQDREEATEDWAERVQSQEFEAMEIQVSESPQMTLDDVEGLEFEDLQSSSASPKPEEEPAPSPKLEEAIPLGIVVPCHYEQSLPIRSPLFRRLHGCIQAAASRLKDFSTKRSTKRVEILVHLIPKEPLPIPGLYCTMPLFRSALLGSV